MLVRKWKVILRALSSRHLSASLRKLKYSSVSFQLDLEILVSRQKYAKRYKYKAKKDDVSDGKRIYRVFSQCRVKVFFLGGLQKDMILFVVQVMQNLCSLSLISFCGVVFSQHSDNP